MGGKIAILRKRLGGAFYLNVPIAAGMFTQLVTLPIILANLRPEDYGLYSFILALEIWLNVLTVPQISFAAKRGVVRGLEGTLLFSYFVRFRLFLIVSAIVWIIAFVLWYVTEYKTFGFLLFIFGGFFLFGVLPQGTWKQFFIAKKKFHQYAIWRGAGLILAPLGGLVAAIQTHNIIVFAAVQFGIGTIVSVIAFIYAIQKYHLLEAYKEGNIDREIVPYGVRLLPASFAVSAADKGAALIIGPFFGFANLAVYSVAEKLTSLFKTFLSTSSHLLYVDFARFSWDTLVRVLKKHFVFAFSLAILVSIGFTAVGYFYIHFFMPDFYQQAKFFLLALSLAFPPLALKGIMYTALDSNFKAREILIVTILPNILRLLLYIVAGLLFGLWGIIWAIVFSAWVEFGLYQSIVMHHEKMKRLVKTLASFWS